jgi:hypothetical protein
MGRHHLLVLSMLMAVLAVAAASKEDITFTDKTWRKYISKEHDPAWTNGTDELSAQGCALACISRP